MLTVLEVVRKTSEFFAGKGIESPRLNAELLVGHALGLPRMRLYLEFERPLSDAEVAAIRELARRRGRREPLQHILGFTEFHGLRLATDRRALIPRPETELLVETVIARWPEAPGRVLDLGTGSGAIALALAAAFPAAGVVAVDSSAQALALAAENAAANGLAGRVSFLLSDWCAQLPGEPAFDLVVSNPPYLSADEVAEAQPEVRDHE
ncbi:MAG TPA: HemK/PrmC family methyltransferase, partial [Opitutaceae bacterium]